MKGLLRKDWLMTKRYCRSILLIVVIYGLVGNEESVSFMRFFPCVLAGMVPVTLLAYDERSRWSEYAAFLPVSASELVGSKYLLGLLLQLFALLFSVLSMTVYSLFAGTFSAPAIAETALTTLSVSLLGAGLCLPFVFRYGVEKGRIAYYIIISLTFGLSAGLSFVSGAGQTEPGGGLLLSVALILFAAGGYVLSWRLGIRCYAKARETR